MYRIGDTGHGALRELRTQGLAEIVIKSDPLDLALTRLDPDALDDLPALLKRRLDLLTSTLDANEVHLASITHLLTVAEVWAMRHQTARRRSEIAWHESLLSALPEIIADERSRRVPS